MTQAHIVERSFFTILLDTLQLISTDPASAGISSGTLGRTAVLNCVILLECTANICIENFEYATLVDAVDRLPFMSKFEVFLELKNCGKKIEKGSSCVQKVQELKGFRDAMVHPKRKRMELKMDGVGFGSYAEIHPGTSPHIKLSNSTSLWDQSDAVRALSATRDFLKYYFNDLLGLAPTEVFDLLKTSTHVSDEKPGFLLQVDAPAALAKAKQKGIDFDFIGLPDAVDA